MNHWDQWTGGYGATPEAMSATQALIGEGSEVAASQAEKAGRQGVANALREWAPVVGAYVKQFQDPNRQVLILEAKLENARKGGASSAKIRILEARLAAAKRNANLQNVSRSQTESVRKTAISATRTATFVGAGVGIALIILILSRAAGR